MVSVIPVKHLRVKIQKYMFHKSIQLNKIQAVLRKNRKGCTGYSFVEPFPVNTCIPNRPHRDILNSEVREPGWVRQVQRAINVTISVTLSKTGKLGRVKSKFLKKGLSPSLSLLLRSCPVCAMQEFVLVDERVTTIQF